MNTTLSTSKFLRSPYTVIGAGRTLSKKAHYPISVVILNHGQRVDKESQYLELEQSGFQEVISVEPPESFYEVEAFARRFSHMKFIVPTTKLTTGECINLAVEEAISPLVLVLWNQIHIPPISFSSKMIKRALESGLCCTIPSLYNRRSEGIMMIHQPIFYKKRRLKVIPSLPNQQTLYSLFPHDYCGLYNKKVFQYMGGFDHHFKSDYWQLLDFGLRTYMWGSKIKCDLTFRLNYLQEAEPIDQSLNSDYALFYLKNLAVRIKNKNAYLPIVRYFSFRRHLDSKEGNSWTRYKEIRNWVYQNRLRYTQNAMSVVHHWEDLELCERKEP